jgi:hypothetical protein
MKNNIKDLALQAGGSTYPEVGGNNLSTFSDLLIKDVLTQIEAAQTKHCALTTHDLGTVKCVVEKITTHIKAHYDIQ